LAVGHSKVAVGMSFGRCRSSAEHDPHQEQEVAVSLAPMPADPITLEDLAHLADADRSHRYELSAEGVLTVMPPPDVEHAAIITRLIAWFLSHGFPPERVLSSAGVKVGGGAGGRQPDLVLRDQSTHNAIYLDPANVLLAIEVESRGSRDIDRITKPREYATAGIDDYWRIARRDGSVMVSLYRRNGDAGYECWRVVPLNELLTDDPSKLVGGLSR
jgi:Uma2 family endonuclease